jgi:hypothetical protein
MFSPTSVLIDVREAQHITEQPAPIRLDWVELSYAQGLGLSWAMFGRFSFSGRQHMSISRWCESAVL